MLTECTIFMFRTAIIPLTIFFRTQREAERRQRLVDNLSSRCKQIENLINNPDSDRRFVLHPPFISITCFLSTSFYPQSNWQLELPYLRTATTKASTLLMLPLLDGTTLTSNRVTPMPPEAAVSQSLSLERHRNCFFEVNST